MALLSHARRYAEEIVEDSEPEREQLRTERKLASLATAVKSPRRYRGPAPEVLDVIELSDSDSDQPVTSPVVVPPPSSTPTNTDKPTLNLTRFAYAPGIAPLVQGPATAGERRSRSSSAEKPTPYQRANVKKANLFNVSSSDVDKISECICCHVAWTRRKTAVQKLNHIQSCAKKYSYDSETVRILIERVGTKASPKPPPATKSSTASSSTTYLEDVVKDKPTKKRTKSKAPASLVTNVDANRPAILARAHVVFSSHTPDDGPPTDQTLPPSTQAFPKSALGGQQVTKNRGISFDDPEAPLPTQGFAGSRLAGRAQKNLFNMDDDDDDVFGASTSTLRRTRSRSSSPASLSPARKLAAIAAYCEETVDPPPDSESDDDAGAVQKPKRGRPRKRSVSPETGSRRRKATKSKTRARSTPKATPKTKRVVYGEGWDTFMKQQIREDEELHLRILRAEPLDFNIFWKIAKEYSPDAAPSRLKTELRNFLDKQAIHFYEEGVWGGKRPKSRS